MEMSVNNEQEMFLTIYEIVFNKELLLSWRPCEPAAGQEMEMKVKHRLPGAAAVINDHPIPVLFKPLLSSYRPRHKEQMADEFAIRDRYAVNICDMFFGDYERMHRRLGVNVFKCYRIIVLMDNI